MTENRLLSLFPHVDPDLLFEMYEERAAIREYEGGYSRETAEELAIEDLHQMFPS